MSSKDSELDIFPDIKTDGFYQHWKIPFAGPHIPQVNRH